MITATIITFITLLSLDDIPLHTSDISNLNKLWDDASRKSIFECKSKFANVGIILSPLIK